MAKKGRKRSNWFPKVRRFNGSNFVLEGAWKTPSQAKSVAISLKSRGFNYRIIQGYGHHAVYWKPNEA